MASSSLASASSYENPNVRKAGLLAAASITVAVSDLELAGGTANDLDIRKAKADAKLAAESDFLVALANDAGGAMDQAKQIGISADVGLGGGVAKLLEEIKRRTDAAIAARRSSSIARDTTDAEEDEDEEEREVERGDPAEDDSQLLLGDIFADVVAEPFPLESGIPVIAEGNEEEEEEEEPVMAPRAEAEAEAVISAVRRERRLSLKALQNQATAAAAAAAAAEAEAAAKAAAKRRADEKAARARAERVAAIAALEKKAEQAALVAAAVKGPITEATKLRSKPGYASTTGSRGTIAGKIIIPSIRLEKATPDQQAIAIHGRTNFDDRTKNGKACCALCGVPFSRRQGQHGKKSGLSISYDHFVPVNFAAIVFRVYSPGTKYSNAEFGILRSIGDMVCWHCNFEKSQRLFLTCPTPGTFAGMRANDRTIGAFLDKMLVSTHASGMDERGDSTLVNYIRECYGEGDEAKRTWKQARMKVIIARANGVAELIKEHVDYDRAKTRYLATRMVIAAQDNELKGQRSFTELPLAKQYIERRKIIASKFAELEASPAWLRPWKDSVVIRDQVEKANQPFSVAPCLDCGEGRPAKRTKSGGARTRRRRLPKLL